MQHSIPIHQSRQRELQDFKLSPVTQDLGFGLRLSVEHLLAQGLVTNETVQIFESELVKRVALGIDSGRIINGVTQQKIDDLRDMCHYVNSMQGTCLRCYYLEDGMAVVFNEAQLKKEALAHFEKDPIQECPNFSAHQYKAMLWSSYGLTIAVLTDCALKSGWFFEKLAAGNIDAAIPYEEISTARFKERRAADLAVKHLVVPSAREDITLWERSVRSHLSSLKKFEHNSVVLWVFIDGEDTAKGHKQESAKRAKCKDLAAEFKVEIRIVGRQEQSAAIKALAEDHENRTGKDKDDSIDEWTQHCLKPTKLGAIRNLYRVYLEGEPSVLAFDDDSLASVSCIKNLSQAPNWISLHAALDQAIFTGSNGVIAHDLLEPCTSSDIGGIVAFSCHRLTIEGETAIDIRNTIYAATFRCLQQSDLISDAKTPDTECLRVGVCAISHPSTDVETVELPVDCAAIAGRVLNLPANQTNMPVATSSLSYKVNVYPQVDTDISNLPVASISFGYQLYAPGSPSRSFNYLVARVRKLLKLELSDFHKAALELSTASAIFYGDTLFPNHTQSFATVTSHAISLNPEHTVKELMSLGTIDSKGVGGWFNPGKSLHAHLNTQLDHLGGRRPFGQLDPNSLLDSLFREHAFLAEVKDKPIGSYFVDIGVTLQNIRAVIWYLEKAINTKQFLGLNAAELSDLRDLREIFIGFREHAKMAYKVDFARIGLNDSKEQLAATTQANRGFIELADATKDLIKWSARFGNQILIARQNIELLSPERFYTLA